MAYQKTYLIKNDESTREIDIYEVTHYKNVDLKVALREAFWDYYKTTEGKKFVADCGTCWGNALHTPLQFLVKHGILSIKPTSDFSHVVINVEASLL